MNNKFKETINKTKDVLGLNKKVVLALGGNALGNTPLEQIEAVKKTALSIVDLVEEGYDILIVHGNGPQVGMINQGMNNSHELTKETPLIPFAECGSMSQGYIGYHLQNAILNELRKREIDKGVASVITQVKVDESDKAFDNYTKPIGSFLTKEEAEELSKKNGYIYKEDSGRGYRRVVPSPEPKEILEGKLIKGLLEDGNIVIAGGGGGIPVIEKDGEYIGVDAVIDKDFTSSLMADTVDADELVVLTAVDQVYLGFGTPEERPLETISVKEAMGYIRSGEFGEGSMKPKIEAMMEFVLGKEGREALITSLERAKEGLAGETGTRVVR